MKLKQNQVVRILSTNMGENYRYLIGTISPIQQVNDDANLYLVANFYFRESDVDLEENIIRNKNQKNLCEHKMKEIIKNRYIKEYDYIFDGCECCNEAKEQIEYFNESEIKYIKIPSTITQELISFKECNFKDSEYQKGFDLAIGFCVRLINESKK